MDGARSGEKFRSASESPDFCMENLHTANDLKIDFANVNRRQYFYLHAGRGEVVLDWGTAPLKPGNIVEAPAGSIFKTYLEAGSKAVRLSASDIFLWSLMPVLRPPPSHAWNAYDKPRIFDYFTGSGMQSKRRNTLQELLAAQERLGGDGDLVIAGYVFVILFQPIFNASSRRPDNIVPLPSSSERDLALGFKGLVEASYRDHVSIPEYCKALGVPYAKLASACRQTLGLAPLQYVNSRVLLEAKRLLLHSEQAIGSIGYELGFSVPNYFTRFFIRSLGCSPARYRREKALSGGRTLRAGQPA